jgi:hypothetical protein
VSRRALTYFVQGTLTKNIKIGKTEDGLPNRLGKLQGSSPDILVCLTTVFGDREHAYHIRFNHLWSHGEWFKPGQDLLDFIAALPKKSLRAGLSLHTKHRGGHSQMQSRAIFGRDRTRKISDSRSPVPLTVTKLSLMTLESASPDLTKPYANYRKHSKRCTLLRLEIRCSIRLSYAPTMKIIVPM